MRWNTVGVVLAMCLVATLSSASEVATGGFDRPASLSRVEQIVAHGLATRPAALILWTNDTTVVGSTGLTFALGVSDGTTSMSSAMASAHNVGPSRASRRMAPSAITIVSATGGLVAEATLVTWDERTFTLAWEAGGNGSTGRVEFLAVGGAGVQARVVGWPSRTTVGPQTVSGIGFRPDLVMHSWVGAGFTQGLPSTSVHGGFGLGVAARGGNQWVFNFFSKDGMATGDTQRYQSTAHSLVGTRADQTIAKAATLTAFTADGFTLDWTLNDNVATTTFSLALAGVDVEAGGFLRTTSTAPIEQAIAGVPFRPGAVVLAGVGTVGTPQVTADSRLGFGASDGLGQTALVGYDLDNANPTVAGRSRHDAAMFVELNAMQGVATRGRLACFDSNGFTIDWALNDAVTTQILYLAIGEDWVAEEEPVAAGPTHLVAQDVDADRLIDVVVTHPASDEISVLKSTEVGRFSPPETYGTGPRPTRARVGNLDGDRLPDIVVLNTNGLTVLHGRAGGTFVSSDWPMPTEADDLVLIDMDLNGLGDVILSDPTTSSLVLLLGDELTGFRQGPSIPLPSPPTCLTTGDLNRDGLLDVVACLPDAGQNLVLLGDGLGFAPPTYHAVGAIPEAVTLGDFNGDGNLDIVLAAPTTQQIVLLDGDGAGGVSALRPIVLGVAASDVAAANLNDDCALDLAVASTAPPQAIVLLGDNLGGFSATQRVGVVESATAVGVMERDGRDSLVLATPALDRLVVLSTGRPPQVRLESNVVSRDCNEAVVDFAPILSQVAATGESWVWDFGDGSASVVETTPSPQRHRFASGRYTVSLRAISPRNECLFTDRIETVVEPAVTALVSPPQSRCVGPSDSTVFFTLSAAHSEVDPGHDISSFLWSTNNAQVVVVGTADEVVLAVPAALAPTVFEVAVEVAIDASCGDTAVTQIALHLAPVIEVSPAVTAVCVGETVTLSATPNLDGYSWSTGESTAAVQVTPTAPLTVAVTGTDLNGCQASASASIAILADDPALNPVTGVVLTKQSAGAIQLEFDAAGSPGGYNLHRTDRKTSLATAPVVLHVAGEQPFVDLPTEALALYQVRGASRCTHVSGP